MTRDPLTPPDTTGYAMTPADIRLWADGAEDDGNNRVAELLRALADVVEAAEEWRDMPAGTIIPNKYGRLCQALVRVEALAP